MTILVTGAAGFIGFSSAARLLANGEEVLGIDNLSPYYDVSLKKARLAVLEQQAGFRFARLDLADRQAVADLFAEERLEAILHLAAQAGVRYSLEQPLAYVDANLVGFGHILEGARAQRVRHLVFASSSSVYGASRSLPSRESDRVDHPITLYAATKRANELAAHSYAHLFGLPCTGLRFFTVYGPWGRPDMALFKFTRGILAGEPIPVFNHGRMVRDFTYVDDVVEAIVRVLASPPAIASAHDVPEDGRETDAPFRLFNIGNNRPIELIDYIHTLEECLGRKAQLQMLPLQPGDVPATMADVSRLQKAIGYRPTTTVAEGIRRFVDWYTGFYGVRT
ncbi:MAG: NAD-dependent epimerase [Alphaproteobacteria bacterium]|nr:NAD-dependent epimerase [Alphaproteobacteria bacterium]MBV9860856.1 NAD-dependent epimerase [Alphaproteobacteria bacterium]